MKKKSSVPVTKPKVTFVFDPVAQNTVIRPMAQAVCIAHGGETIPYTDTSDHEKKQITLSDLYYLTLTAKIGGRRQTLDGTHAAMMAKQMPVLVRVDVNDVQVFVSKETTLAQAMQDFHKKINSQYDYLLNREAPSRQRE